MPFPGLQISSQLSTDMHACYIYKHNAQSCIYMQQGLLLYCCIIVGQCIVIYSCIHNCMYATCMHTWSTFLCIYIHSVHVPCVYIYIHLWEIETWASITLYNALYNYTIYMIVHVHLHAQHEICTTSLILGGLLDLLHNKWSHIISRLLVMCFVCPITVGKLRRRRGQWVKV